MNIQERSACTAESFQIFGFDPGTQAIIGPWFDLNVGGPAYVAAIFGRDLCAVTSGVTDGPGAQFAATVVRRRAPASWLVAGEFLERRIWQQVRGFAGRCLSAGWFVPGENGFQEGGVVSSSNGNRGVRNPAVIRIAGLLKHCENFTRGVVGRG